MIVFTGAFFILGLLFFYTSAAFGSYDSVPAWVYYWWAKSLDVCFFYCLTEYTNKKYRPLFKPLFYFSLIRFVWDIVSYFSGITISDNRAIAFLFMALVTILFWQFLKELIKWQK